MPPRPLIAGNWKMNGLRADGTALAADLVARVKAKDTAEFDMVLCPPAVLVSTVVLCAAGSAVAVGGQDCHAKTKGAHTGDISAAMLKDAGCSFVIVGHSERRQNHGESDAIVRAKAEAAQQAGLTAIICVGEDEAQRDAGAATDIVVQQLTGSLPTGSIAENTVIAYEPIWAIGTGRTPTLDDITAMHAAIRIHLKSLVSNADSVRVLYGGSVKASNAAAILALDHVNGALVGGASLVADEFWAIAQAART